MKTEQTWQISDLDGGNKRTVTLAQFKAENARKAAEAKVIFAADCKRADLKAPLRWTPQTARQRVGGTFGS